MAEFIDNVEDVSPYKRLLKFSTSRVLPCVIVAIIVRALITSGNDPAVKIATPTVPEVAKLEDYSIVVMIDHEAKIYFQGEAVGSAAQIESKVRSAIGDRTDDTSRTVLFRCDKTVDIRVFQPVIEAIANGGGRIAAFADQSVEK